jgi:endoglucanase
MLHLDRAAPASLFFTDQQSAPMRTSSVLLASLVGFTFPLHTQTVIRINQLGYLPHAVKTAVLMSSDTAFRFASWDVRDALTGNVVWRSGDMPRDTPYGRFTNIFRLDFSAFATPGAYFLSAASARSPSFRIDASVYDGTADFLLQYMRQQRCGYNPYLNDSCHTHDGYIIYRPPLDSTFIDVIGGWHDASDYLKYVTTSANATFQLLFAYTQNAACFGDAFGESGRPGANGIPDILDEAKWGLDWLVKMNPGNGVMFNQIADDRDHMGFKLPTLDTISYGKGLERPVYFCTGNPQGVLQYKNRSTGIASTAGKYASAFALGSETLQRYYPDFCAILRTRAVEAYEWGKANPGVCQTAPCRAPYFYEEDNWVDDMELAATQLYRLTGDSAFLHDAMQYGQAEPVVPWMGADGARHYQWYPFVNLGHYFLARQDEREEAQRVVTWLKDGIDRVKQRGETKPFRFGVPFIWCSNNLVSAILTQLRVYGTVSEDSSYIGMEAALRDWLFGCNPWGTSMIVGLPKHGVAPRDPHSAFTHVYGYPIDGGLVDGPVRASIFNSLKGVQLSKEDPFKDFQSDSSVYHDDWADYSTNEPTMDGTASLTYYLSSLQAEGAREKREDHLTIDEGAVIRMDSTKNEIYLVFTGHEFADGGTTIQTTLRHHGIKASFFFTGDFYRAQRNRTLIKRLVKEGHYLGPHSNKHILYASWRNRDSLLVSKEQFLGDLRDNYRAMSALGIAKINSPIFLPPFEWYNTQIAEWCRESGVRLVNFTPGTRSNADYTVPGVDENYRSSNEIENSILEYAASRPGAMNGFILLMHIGTDPRRTDKLYRRLDGIIAGLKHRGYEFHSFGQQ